MLLHMRDPGLERHDWESEMESLEEDLRSDPAEALSELDALIARMLDETGYDPRDPVVRSGDDREIVAEFLAAHEITEAVERDAPELSPGDVAAAINGYRAIFEYLVNERSTEEVEYKTSDS
ncbi:MAG: hypothetical protein QOE36_1300 [Gaiellaceae bacterium]|jgi:hypothetical protein|nr:hypothetical protein [Gaiellaceae bacterium]